MWIIPVAIISIIWIDKLIRVGIIRPEVLFKR